MSLIGMLAAGRAADIIAVALRWSEAVATEHPLREPKTITMTP